MNYKHTFGKLIKTGSEICVTISLNTHRTHPDNLADKIQLKNLISEAKNRLEANFVSADFTNILKYMNEVEDEIDHNKNLESLHIFVSTDSKEIFRSPWPVAVNSVTVDDHFNLIPLIKFFNRSEHYFILLLSQNGAIVYEAINKNIVDEIQSRGFPFPETGYFAENKKRASDADYVDNLLKNYLNEIDKAVNTLHKDTDLNFVVVATETNYRLLLEVADNPQVYIGNVPINYNRLLPGDIVEPAWEIAKTYQRTLLNDAISRLHEKAGKDKALTNPEAIYEAALQGRGEFLFIYDKVLESSTDNELLTRTVAEVISKNGWVYVVDNADTMKGNNILLKIRY